MTRVLITCLGVICAMSSISTIFAQDTLDDILGEMFGDTEVEVDTEIEAKIANKNDADPVEEKIEVNLNPLQKNINNVITNKKNDDGTHDTAADLLEQLNNDDWTYAGDADPIAKLKQANETSVMISTSKAMYQGMDVLDYNIFYHTTPLSTANNSDIMTKKISGTSNNDMVELELTGLEKNTTYYVVIAPINPENENKEPLDKLTNEITFITKDDIAVPSPSIEKIKNVSYKNNKNNIEITWKSAEGSKNKVDISLRHNDDITYTTVGNINADTETFSFSVDKAGPYFIKIKLLDSTGSQIGADSNLNLTIKEFEETTPTITNPPAVGPKTDLLIALAIFAAMMYIVYRVRSSKQD